MNFLTYAAVNKVNGKTYIGKADDMDRRRKSHLRAARSGTPYPFHRAIRKYGIDGFDWCVLSQHHKEQRALDAEIRWIKKYRSDGCILYNMTKGGDGVSGYRHTKETRRKLSERPPVVWTDENKERMRQIMKIRVFTPEHRERISESLKGHAVTVVTRCKLSEAMKGNSHTKGQTLSKEHKEKIGAAHRGKKLSPEHIEAIRAGNLGKRRPGRVLSDDHKKRIGEGLSMAYAEGRR